MYEPSTVDPDDLKIAPTSDLQHGWWFWERAHLNPDLVMSAQFVVDGFLDRTVLAEAIRRLMTRHESLRTNFAGMGGGTVQVVWPTPEPVPLYVEDLAGVEPGDADELLSTIADRERNYNFELSGESLVRFVLILTGPASCVLSVAMHHIIADGWAFGVVLNELPEQYDKVLAGEPAEPPAPLRFRDWVLEERAFNGSAAHDRQLEYWRETLRTLRPLHLPRDREPSDPLYFRSAGYELGIAPELAAALIRAARGYRSTPFMVGLTAMLQVLAARTGRTEVAAITLVSRRHRPDTHGLVGCLMNAMTINAEIDEEASPAELVSRVRARLLRGYDHKEVFVTRVWDAVGLAPGDIDALFVYDRFEPSELRFGGNSTRPLFTSGLRTFERYGRQWENLKLRLEQRGAELYGHVEYNGALYDESTIAGFADEFLRRLERICSPALSAAGRGVS